MAVIEDFEDVSDWTTAGASTFECQAGVAVVGKALRIYGNTGGNVQSGAYNKAEYGLYIRSDTVDTLNNIKMALYTTTAMSYGVIFVVNLANGNFGVCDGGGDNRDLGVAMAADTWYWVGLKRNTATSAGNADLIIMNEAKDTTIYSEDDIGFRDGAWVVADAAFLLAQGDGTSSEAYFDQLTDEGTAPTPPAGGATLNMKGYW